MKISILIPHWKTGKLTAYTIAQLLKYKGNHDLTIIVVDNNPTDDSSEYFKPFEKDIIYMPYSMKRVQSHGVAFDYALMAQLVDSDYFICLESDSFPVKEGCLDYYEVLANRDIDAAGSVLRLSGGEFLHPTGTMYKKSVWEEAFKYVEGIEYVYLPNMALKDGFECHLMVHKRILEQLKEAPEDYIELSASYKPDAEAKILEKYNYYLPIAKGVFHNGMSMREESVRTYGFRTVHSEAPMMILDNKIPLIKKIGMEPGQWLSYYMAATNKKIFEIPIETKWLEGKENIQQEYTLNEAGIKHLWGCSAYFDFDGGDKEITKIKRQTPEELYNSLPIHQRI